MIIFAHVIMFVGLFAVGLPWLNSTFGPEVAFGGGLIAAALMALASEVVVLGSAVIARAITLALKINPLLQRNKATLIAHAVIFVVLSGFLATVSLVFPQVISVSLTWALLLSGLTVAVLEVMVRVKRYLIAKS
jgi:hypothetical protein